jgi:hypothetical protein
MLMSLNAARPSELLVHSAFGTWPAAAYHAGSCAAEGEGALYIAKANPIQALWRTAPLQTSSTELIPSLYQSTQPLLDKYL